MEAAIQHDLETARRMVTAPTLTNWPKQAMVACQGVPGAYSQLAAAALFEQPELTFYPEFEAVFTAIEEGRCRYGVLPIENSTAGSVNRIYDLMQRYHCYIVRSRRQRICHQLLVKPGVRAEQIKAVYSHEQAVQQCSRLLKELGVTVHIVANTAVAANMVAGSDRVDVAAIASKACCQLYGLEAVMTDIQDQPNNFTRFICITKEPMIYSGASRSSLMVALRHESGSLYRFLGLLYKHRCNLMKLESRPIPGREFEFMFYFDFEGPLGEPLAGLLEEIEEGSECWTYLGSYEEMKGEEG